MRSLYRSLILSACLLAVPATVMAAPGAEGFLRNKQDELFSLLKKNGNDAVNRQIEGVFDQMLDYRTLAKESLREHWNERTDAERQEFETLLKQLVQNAYRKSLRKTLDYEVNFVGEVKSEDSYLVKTVARSRTNSREEPIAVDYVMHKVDGKWRVYDIVTEGSSLVKNYQNQFRRVIKKKGFDELMRRMKRKLKEEQA